MPYDNSILIYYYFTIIAIAVCLWCCISMENVFSMIFNTDWERQMSADVLSVCVPDILSSGLAVVQGQSTDPSFFQLSHRKFLIWCLLKERNCCTHLLPVPVRRPHHLHTHTHTVADFALFIFVLNIKTITQHFNHYIKLEN